MALGAILGGIAASPFRAAGGVAKFGYRAGKAGAKGLALTALDVTGALPLFAGAVAAGKAVGKGVQTGKDLLRPWGTEPGAVTKDSAEKAITAAATETAKLDAETKKIEAETAALTGKKATVEAQAAVQAKTSMGGVDVEILEKIYGEVVSIRGLLGGKDPESEKKELKLDEQVRHKNFLKALAALGMGGKDKEKKPWFDLGNLKEMLMGMLPAIIAGLGLAGLVALWPQISKAFVGISDAVANINEFLDDMAAFFKPMADWLNSVDPAKLAASAGALRATKTLTSQKKTRAQMKAAAVESKKQAKIDKKANQKKIRDDIKRKHALRKIELAEQKKIEKKVRADAKAAKKASARRFKPYGGKGGADMGADRARARSFRYGGVGGADMGADRARAKAFRWGGAGGADMGADRARARAFRYGGVGGADMGADRARARAFRYGGAGGADMGADRARTRGRFLARFGMGGAGRGREGGARTTGRMPWWRTPFTGQYDLGGRGQEGRARGTTKGGMPRWLARLTSPYGGTGQMGADPDAARTRATTRARFLARFGMGGAGRGVGDTQRGFGRTGNIATRFIKGFGGGLPGDGDARLKGPTSRMLRLQNLARAAANMFQGGTQGRLPVKLPVPIVGFGGGLPGDGDARLKGPQKLLGAPTGQPGGRSTAGPYRDAIMRRIQPITPLMGPTLLGGNLTAPENKVWRKGSWVTSSKGNEFWRKGHWMSVKPSSVPAKAPVVQPLAKSNPPIQKGPIIDKVLDKIPDAKKKTPIRGGLDRARRLLTTKPFINPITNLPMNSQVYFDKVDGQWHEVVKGKPGVRGPVINEQVALDYLKKSGIEMQPDGKGGFKNLTSKQLSFLGERKGFMSRVRNNMRWGGAAAGLLSLVLIGFAVNAAFNRWQETKPKGDKWPFDDSSEADKNFKTDLWRLAAAFGVGWIVAVVSGLAATALTGNPFVGILAGVIGGFMGGMAADQITAWLRGDSVESTGWEGVKEGWKAQVAEHGIDRAMMNITGLTMLGTLPGVAMDWVRENQVQPSEGQQRTDDLNLITTIEDELRPIYKRKHIQGKKLYGHQKDKLEEMEARLNKAGTAYTTDELELLRKKTASKVNLGAASARAIPDHGEEVGKKFSNILGGSSLTDTKPETSQLMSSGENLQTNFNIEGTDLTQAGANGGVFQANTVIYNQSKTINSDSSSATNLSETTNFIDFGSLEAQGNMRARYA